MHTPYRRLPLVLALCCAFPLPSISSAFGAQAAQSDRSQVASAAPNAADAANAGHAQHARQDNTLGAVVVTAPLAAEALTVTTDPKAPRQPIPAHDGADFLKSIPGFSVIRKGGTDGDPVLRGMSGSRLGIFLDGQEIFGGCGGRMDPPTAYVYPESYDRVTVRKGPQSVLYGAGNSAGVVLFERDIRRFAEAGWLLDGSLTLGSFGRNDQVVDLRAGNPGFYAQASATRSDSDDYEDGDGRKVHSAYTRWSGNVALGWTPDDDTRLELSAGRSDGEAAYADRGMDGSKFARENIALKFDKRRLSPLLEQLEGQLYYSYIDHVMDNFSLRDLAPGTMRMLSNPDRITRGGRVAATLTPSEALRLTVGADAKDDLHRARSAMGMADYHAAKRAKDFGFERYGLFGEATWTLDDERRLIGGLRLDRHRVEDYRASSATRGDEVKDSLSSGFLRYEADYRAGAASGTWYAGLGHSQRFPDFWEFMRADGANGQGFNTLKPEKTTQLDVGTLWSSGDWSASLSGFYGKIDDHVLIRWLAPAAVRNVDATVYGLEGETVWRFAANWRATGTLAWVHGRNDTDGKALAQQPPLEGRLALDYNDQTFSYGALLRLVARQDRYDLGSGGIVANGMDLGPTAGFAVVSLNAGWRASPKLLLTAGIDNLFDRSYREHLSKSAAAITGYETLTGERINEPGRILWLKARITLD